jgi:hypothetical protein
MQLLVLHIMLDRNIYLLVEQSIQKHAPTQPFWCTYGAIAIGKRP